MSILDKFSLEGQVAIITGGGAGIGKSIAQHFAGAGAKVVVSDLKKETADAVAREINDAGGEAIALDCDVTDEAARKKLVEDSVAKFGKVTILVNNAGGVRGQVGRPIEEISPADWQAIFAVNVDGAFFFVQAVAPHMKERKAGRIINISSGAGLGISLTGIQAYASAKAAQIGLTRQLAHELGAWGITVNNVAPGFVRSNPTTERQWESYGEDGQRKLIDGIALKRLGTSEDIANAVLFFASEQAGWVTGHTILVDGGALAAGAWMRLPDNTNWTHLPVIVADGYTPS